MIVGLVGGSGFEVGASEDGMMQVWEIAKNARRRLAIHDV